MTKDLNSVNAEIDELTKLIDELENSFPKRDITLGKYHEFNRPYELHWRKIDDTYFRRLMLINRSQEWRLPDIEDWPDFKYGGKYLCLIRYKNNVKEHGFFIEGSWNLHLGYVWDGGNGEYIEYSSSDEALHDGWIVD